MTETAFQADAFQNDAFQIVVVATTADRADYPWPSRSDRHSKKRRERPLDLAVEKALESKRRKVIRTEPWLVEPVLPPPILPVPEFNPALAALADRAALIQAELDRIKFIQEQEEADIELLLMSI